MQQCKVQGCKMDVKVYVPLNICIQTRHSTRMAGQMFKSDKGAKNKKMSVKARMNSERLQLEA